MKGLARTLGSDELSAIASAVASVQDRLRPDDLADLYQDLAVVLLKQRIAPEDLGHWLKTCAKNWASALKKAEARRLGVMQDLRDCAPVPQWQRGDLWHPTWYPPHRDAKEFAPFAMKDARMMTCKPGMRKKREE